MRIGTLRERVSLLQPVVTRDTQGGLVTTWSTLASNVPAAVVPVGGRESLELTRTLAATTSYAVTLRGIAG